MRVVVIGAGISGLGAAALLAGEHEVRVLEALPRAGGVAAAIDLDGVRFCPGPQYLWGFGEGGEGRRILARMGLELPVSAMPADFDWLGIGAGTYQAVVAGRCAPALERVLSERPDQRGPAERFTRTLDRIGRACVALSDGARFMERGAAMMRRVLAWPGASWEARALVLRHYRDSVAGFARRVGLGPAALRVLTYQQGIFAERLESLSLVLYAAARYHLVRQLHVPAGGTRGLVEALVGRVEERGRLSLGQLVTEVVRAGEAWIVRHRGPSGRLHSSEADRVIFACAAPAVGRLLPSARLRCELGHSVSALCLSLAIAPAAADWLERKNVTWFRSPRGDVDFRRSPQALDYLNFTSPTLNGGERREEGGLVRCALVAYYPDGEEAPGLAAQAEGHILRALRARGRAVLRARRVISRRTWQAEFGSEQGAIYGRRMSSRSIRRRAAGRLPPGISMAHSSAGIPGVMGCLEMAERAADAILAPARR